MWDLIKENKNRTTLLFMVLFFASFIPAVLIWFFINDRLFALALLIEIALINGIILMVSFMDYSSSLFIDIIKKESRPLAVAKATREVYPRLLDIVEEISISAGLKRVPNAYVLPDLGLNALSEKVKSKEASIIVTSGLLSKLSRDELQGVIAHEIAHIVNGNVPFRRYLLSLIGATHFAKIHRHSFFILSTDQEKRYVWETGRMKMRSLLIEAYKFYFRPLVAFALISFIAYFISRIGDSSVKLMLILSTTYFTPLNMWFVTELFYVVGAEKAEYLADAFSVLYTRYPEGLASALEKMSELSTNVKGANTAKAPLFIVNPYKDTDFASNEELFFLKDRIQILRAMGKVSLAEYNKAYLALHTEPIIAQEPVTLGNSSLNIRNAVNDRSTLGKLATVRNTLRLIRAQAHYKTIQCICGVALHIPPKFIPENVTCPHCGRIYGIVEAKELPVQIEIQENTPPISDNNKLEVSETGFKTIKCECGTSVSIPLKEGDSPVFCPSCGQIYGISELK